MSEADVLTDGPGSTGKNRPECFICSFRLIQGTDGWTTTSKLLRAGQVLHSNEDPSGTSAYSSS